LIRNINTCTHQILRVPRRKPNFQMYERNFIKSLSYDNLVCSGKVEGKVENDVKF
jgi:hypothetical protein